MRQEHATSIETIIVSPRRPAVGKPTLSEEKHRRDICFKIYRIKKNNNNIINIHTRL